MNNETLSDKIIIIEDYYDNGPDNKGSSNILVSDVREAIKKDQKELEALIFSFRELINFENPVAQRIIDTILFELHKWDKKRKDKIFGEELTKDEVQK